MKLTYCPFCLSAVQGDICPHCGKDIFYTGDPMHLQVGYVLNGIHPYVLGASLGQGGFGITYIALDIMTNRRVAVKEYFPTYCAGRNGDVSVISYSGQEETFHKGKVRFLEEARMLKSLSDLPSVVNVVDFFEANNSAYLVMEFLDGSSLKDYVEQKGCLPAQSFLKQMEPLMADMEKMHRRGVVHRDIAPDNIIMLPSGQLKLIDFGAARSYVGDKSMTVVVKKGFAPVEQYMRKGSNASTDIYALAATIYYCITGIVPPDSVERQYGEADLRAPTELGAELSEAQELVLEKALAIQPNERTQSIAEMIMELEKAGKTPVPVQIPKTDKRPERPKKENSRTALQEKTPTERKVKTASSNGQNRWPASVKPEQYPAPADTDSDSIRGTTRKKKWMIPVIAASALFVLALCLLPAPFAPERISEVESGETTMPITLKDTSVTQVPQTEPVPEQSPDQAEPALTDSLDNEFSFTVEDEGDAFRISGENIHISVRNGNQVTATLGGLNMKDEYVVNLGTTKKNHWEYCWYIEMSDGVETNRISTYTYAEEPGKENIKALNDFDHALLRRESDSDGQYYVRHQEASMTFTTDSITWNYTMDNESLLDFRNVTEFNVCVQDPLLDLYVYRTYMKDTSGQAQPAEKTLPETPPVGQTSLPGQQLIFEEELSFTSNKIEAVRVRSNGYSLHSAKFLDKPLNNCVSLSAQITVEEGSPEEFILYLQDLTKWYEAGRFKANGERVTNGTLTLNKPVSFNAFAIVPAEGDYSTSISYKLTGAAVKGNPLQSVHTGNNTVFTGDNLEIRVNDNREVIITVSGLNLLDEYPSRISFPKGSREYQWNVRLTSGQHSLSFQTDCPVPVAKFNQPKITQWKDMKHMLLLELLEFGELDDHIIKRDKATVSHTADSITWTYLLDKNQPFDFSSGITAEVFWYDEANHDSDYQYYFGR